MFSKENTSHIQETSRSFLIVSPMIESKHKEEDSFSFQGEIFIQSIVVTMTEFSFLRIIKKKS